MDFWTNNNDNSGKIKEFFLYPLLMLLYVNIAMALIFVTYLMCNIFLHLFDWINEHIF